MKKLAVTTLVFILALTGCGIKKESAPPLSSVAGGDLDTTFNGQGYFVHSNAAGGSLNDEGFGMTVDAAGRVVVVGSSINGSGNEDLVVWRLTSDGELDTSFNSTGFFVIDNIAGGSGSDVGFAVTTNSSNEIFVTGYSMNGSSNFDMIILKLTNSGSLDTSFNSTGVFIHDNAAGGSVHDRGNDIALDNSGNIYVTGYSDQSGSNRDLAIWKVTSTGTLDTGFDSDGIFTHDGAAGGTNEIGNAITISGSNIFITGRADPASGSADMVVWKLSSSGNLDTSFSGDGIFTHNSAAGGNAFDAGNDLLIDSVGSVYVTGQSRNNSNNNDMVIWKLSTSGSLDTSFSGDGYFVYNIQPAVGTSTDDMGESIAIDSNENLLVVGSGNLDAAAWKVSPSGELDSSFNADGAFFHDSAAGAFGTDAGKGIYFDSSNQILYMSGYSENAMGNFDMVVWKIK